MSSPKKCIFVKERVCPFQGTQVAFQTCQLCIEAWKTEVAIKKQQLQGYQTPVFSPQPQHGGISAPSIENNGTTIINERLKELDDLLKDDKIDPLEYIRRRKEQVNSLIEGKPKFNIEEVEEPVEEIKPVPRETRVAIITKTLFRKQITTAPEHWELPKTISDKVIDSIFKMTEKKSARDIKLRAGEYKIACIAAEKDKLALLVMDADEEFETYESEIDRVAYILDIEKNWAEAAKSISN